MRVLLAVLAAILPTGCALEYAVGDLSEIECTKKVREEITSPVRVEFQVEYYYGGKRPSSPGILFLFGGGLAHLRAVRYEKNRREVFAYIASLGVFGALETDPDSARKFVVFGARGREEILQVRLTLSMNDRWQQAVDWVQFLSVSMIPTWKTFRRDMVAEVWDSSGNLLLFKVYEERHRRIKWLPLSFLAWPFELFAPAYRGRIRRQIDHFMVDLRNVLRRKGTTNGSRAGHESFAE